MDQRWNKQIQNICSILSNMFERENVALLMCVCVYTHTSIIKIQLVYGQVRMFH